jgi:hypothetical protein
VRTRTRHEEGNDTWEEDGGGAGDGPFSATSGLKAAMSEGKPSTRTTMRKVRNLMAARKKIDEMGLVVVGSPRRRI